MCPSHPRRVYGQQRGVWQGLCRGLITGPGASTHGEPAWSSLGVLVLGLGTAESEMGARQAVQPSGETSALLWFGFKSQLGYSIIGDFEEEVTSPL